MIKNTLPDKSWNPEILENFLINVSIVSKNLLRAFYRLFYLQFCDSSNRWKTLCSKDFTGYSRDNFAWKYL